MLSIDEQVTYLRKGFSEMIREEDLRERLKLGAVLGRYGPDVKRVGAAVSYFDNDGNFPEHRRVDGNSLPRVQQCILQCLLQTGSLTEIYRFVNYRRCYLVIKRRGKCGV